MANELRNNHVWAVDTAASTLVTDENCFIGTIRWVTRTGAAVIKNDTGKVIWEAAAADGAESYIAAPLHCPKGFAVTTLGGGVLYIYLMVGGIRG